MYDFSEHKRIILGDKLRPQFYTAHEDVVVFSCRRRLNRIGGRSFAAVDIDEMLLVHLQLRAVNMHQFMENDFAPRLCASFAIDAGNNDRLLFANQRVGIDVA